MITTKQYLKILTKKQILKLVEETNLDYLEKWILIYSFVDKRMVENICMRLNISKSKYFYVLKNALIKVEFTIQKYDKIRTF